MTKITEGAEPFLEDGEEVLAALVARPRGWTQSMAGSGMLGAAQQGKARNGAEAAGFQLASPMVLAVTQRRLLSFKAASARGKVEELVGAAPHADVDAIEIKRLLLGKVVTVTVRGVPFKLEVNAKADAKGVADAFDRAKAGA
ncbi:MAG: hypothetical protein ABI611_08020 [Solirubrobacteraceae bacterium]